MSYWNGLMWATARNEVAGPVLRFGMPTNGGRGMVWRRPGNEARVSTCSIREVGSSRHCFLLHIFGARGDRRHSSHPGEPNVGRMSWWHSGSGFWNARLANGKSPQSSWRTCAGMRRWNCTRKYLARCSVGGPIGRRHRARLYAHHFHHSFPGGRRSADYRCGTWCMGAADGCSRWRTSRHRCGCAPLQKRDSVGVPGWQASGERSQSAWKLRVDQKNIHRRHSLPSPQR